MSLYEIYEKIAAKNPAVPAAASEQKAGDLNPRGVEANYMAGKKAGKQVAGDVKRSTAPGDGYVSLNGAQPAGQQKGGFVNRHGAPDGGERGSTGPDTEALTKAAGDKTVVGKGSPDGRVKGRPHLKNQGVSGVFTLTKDASMRELGIASGIKLAMDMEEAKKKAKKKADELKDSAKAGVKEMGEKVKDVAKKVTGHETRADTKKRQFKRRLKNLGLGYLGGAGLGAAVSRGHPDATLWGLAGGGHAGNIVSAIQEKREKGKWIKKEKKKKKK